MRVVFALASLTVALPMLSQALLETIAHGGLILPVRATREVLGFWQTAGMISFLASTTGLALVVLRGWWSER